MITSTLPLWNVWILAAVIKLFLRLDNNTFELNWYRKIELIFICGGEFIDALMLSRIKPQL